VSSNKHARHNPSTPFTIDPTTIHHRRCQKIICSIERQDGVNGLSHRTDPEESFQYSGVICDTGHELAPAARRNPATVSPSNVTMTEPAWPIAWDANSCTNAPLLTPTLIHPPRKVQKGPERSRKVDSRHHQSRRPVYYSYKHNYNCLRTRWKSASACKLLEVHLAMHPLTCDCTYLIAPI
jgi:hypothetical protein